MFDRTLAAIARAPDIATAAFRTIGPDRIKQRFNLIRKTRPAATRGNGPPLTSFASPVTIAQPTARSGASRATRQIGGGIAASPFHVQQQSSPDEASQYICAHYTPLSPEHAQAVLARHVSAIAAGHRPRPPSLNAAGAADHFELSVRLCGRADFLWPGFRSPRPPTFRSRELERWLSSPTNPKTCRRLRPRWSGSSSER
jgi:hypothetical protein